MVEIFALTLAAATLGVLVYLAKHDASGCGWRINHDK
jgi:hypothetical protein